MLGRSRGGSHTEVWGEGLRCEVRKWENGVDVDGYFKKLNEK